MTDLRDGDLFGPDQSDDVLPVEIQTGDRVDVWAWQIVNRWVYLKHQRPAALADLRELIAHLRAER